MTGKVKGVACPRCGGTIVYNGNYYCSDQAEDGCRWMNPAVFGGRYTKEEAEFVFTLVETYVRECLERSKTEEERARYQHCLDHHRLLPIRKRAKLRALS